MSDQLTETPAAPACESCHIRVATHAKRSLCRRCYMSAWRRAKQGEPWAEAVEAVKRGAERRAKGFVR